MAPSAATAFLRNVLLLLIHTAECRLNRPHSPLHGSVSSEQISQSVASAAAARTVPHKQRPYTFNLIVVLAFPIFPREQRSFPVPAFSWNDETVTHTAIITARQITRIYLHTSPPSLCFSFLSIKDLLQCDSKRTST